MEYCSNLNNNHSRRRRRFVFFSIFCFFIFFPFSIRKSERLDVQIWIEYLELLEQKNSSVFSLLHSRLIICYANKSLRFFPAFSWFVFSFSVLDKRRMQFFVKTSNEHFKQKFSLLFFPMKTALFLLNALFPSSLSLSLSVAFRLATKNFLQSNSMKTKRKKNRKSIKWKIWIRSTWLARF